MGFNGGYSAGGLGVMGAFDDLSRAGDLRCATAEVRGVCDFEILPDGEENCRREINVGELLDLQGKFRGGYFSGIVRLKNKAQDFRSDKISTNERPLIS